MEAVGGGNHGGQRLFWAGLRSGEAAWELQRGEVKVELGSNRIGVGWRGVLCGAQAGPATMAGGGGVAVRRVGEELGPGRGKTKRRNTVWLRRQLKRRRGQRHGDAWTRTPRSCGGASRGVDEGDGGLVNNSKFQNAVCKFSFSPSSWPQMKNS